MSRWTPSDRSGGIPALDTGKEMRWITEKVWTTLARAGGRGSWSLMSIFIATFEIMIMKMMMMVIIIIVVVIIIISNWFSLSVSWSEMWSLYWKFGLLTTDTVQKKVSIDQFRMNIRLWSINWLSDTIRVFVNLWQSSLQEAFKSHVTWNTEKQLVPFSLKCSVADSSSLQCLSYTSISLIFSFRSEMVNICPNHRCYIEYLASKRRCNATTEWGISTEDISPYGSWCQVKQFLSLSCVTLINQVPLLAANQKLPEM